VKDHSLEFIGSSGHLPTNRPVSLKDKGRFELELAEKYPVICGVDEVGRGCLAGPVCAAAVILDMKSLLKLPAKDLNLVRDSKKLSSNQRQTIIPKILAHAQAVQIEFSTPSEIDQLNILNGTFLAMRRAIHKLTLRPSLVLVDGNQKIPELELLQWPIVGGDAVTFSIAAASILAKDWRDQYMIQLEQKWPGYGFDKHVGYGTKQHLQALSQLGITQEHRKSFAPVARILELNISL